MFVRTKSTPNSPRKSIQIVESVREDNKVKQALQKRDAITHTHPRSRVARKYNEIARKIAGDIVEDSNWFSRIFGKEY